MITTCCRCGAAATSVMAFAYGERRMWLADLDTADRGYGLCDRHAARMGPPVGWVLEDRRAPARRLFAVPGVG